MSVRKIIHIDMDAFFAAVEQRDNPALRGKPIAVGHNGPRGVVATASYEARKFGVRSAISAQRAKKLCPHLIFIPAHMETYKKVSHEIRTIFKQYTELIEPLSIDEAFLDVSHLPNATETAEEIKSKIFRLTGLTASAGVSVNKMLAKIASDYKKPNGLFVIKPKQVEKFVAKLPIEKFFGIGKVTAQKMHQLGIYTGADLRKKTEPELTALFGKAGHAYFGYARGIDERPVEPNRKHLSVGTENTFDTDSNDLSVLHQELESLARRTWQRAARIHFCGKTVTLKLKYANFKQITRSHTFEQPISSEEELFHAGKILLQKANLTQQKARLLGLSISNPLTLCPKDAQLLFDF